ncbi:MAG: hypothetical protein JKY85_03370 [Porticoccus sp.]|nr:hypothetical protein [Porticoccus sp.]
MKMIDKVLPFLKDGKAARNVIADGEDEERALTELQLLTTKPVLYICNVDEDSAATGNEFSKAVQEMADKNGRFLGSGISEIKENKLFLKENILFPVSGNYQVSIYQAMRKNGVIDGLKFLEGITEVGFRIEKE